MSHPLTHHVPIKHILLLFLLWGCFNVFSCLGTTLSITAYRGTNSVVSRRSESFLMTESQCEEIKTPMILHVVVATNGWFINVTQSSEWEQPQSVKARLFFFFFLINHYSLIIVADCIYPSRGRHYEWFECPWIFHQLDLTDGWIIMCRYSLYNTSLPPDWEVLG